MPNSALLRFPTL